MPRNLNNNSKKIGAGINRLFISNSSGFTLQSFAGKIVCICKASRAKGFSLQSGSHSSINHF
jgi:hypothetical protein